MKVLIVVNHAREDAMESARRLEDWLDERGVDVAWAHDKRRFPLAVDSADDCDLVVSLGGDGTLLRAARIVGYAGVPVLGISYGHLGFLTAAGPEDLMVTVRDALAGELHVSRRATLDVECEFERPDGTTYTRHSFALNDFALSRGGAGDMVEFDVSVSGKHIDRLRGDGFVVSTATGSTGYALAAGGPIVTPEFTGMVCVPIAPHTIMARAFLLALGRRGDRDEPGAPRHAPLLRGRAARASREGQRGRARLRAARPGRPRPSRPELAELLRLGLEGVLRAGGKVIPRGGATRGNGRRDA